MKICVFTDIHGNLESLNLLMQTNDFKTSDLKICLGDAVVMGPYPNECCEALLKNDCIWLMGNHDCYIANGLPEEEYKFFKPDKIAHQNYMRSIIKNEHKEIMKNLPKDYLINIGAKKLYFTHYIWETCNNVIDNPNVPTVENISQIYKNINADYIFYGHEHHFSHFKDTSKEYICVGSLGMVHPGHYTIIEAENNTIKIKHKTINFNLEKYKQDILNSNYPRAEKYTKFFN